MIDRDLAEMYEVEVKRLNEQVKRNIHRFPESFRFQLTNTWKNELVANCDRFEMLKHSSSNPYAFTEQGVAMRSAVLRSDTAIKVLLYSKNISKQMGLDVRKADEQYGYFEIKPFAKSHDRFLISDSTEVYHLGASLKDLGKKWFAFTRLDKISVESFLTGLENG